MTTTDANMKFTILSHAGMLIERDGTSLLVDPWLFGSCYWRSWWNYPEPPQDIIENLAPDYIYLTHLHWDHFHGASLRRLKRNRPDLKVIVPKLYTTKMVTDLGYCDINNVIEVAHGGHLELAPGFTLHSYQFDISTDSCIVVTDGTTTIFDVNDCKIFGAPLRQITGKFPNIDFVLRSHSSATALPYCVEGYEKHFPDVRSPEEYIKDYTNFARHIGARYAVPFASNHCFLHRDTLRFNKTIVSPAAVKAQFDRITGGKGGTECVIMPPGSSWSRNDGFKIAEFDYARQDEVIAGMMEKNREKLEKFYQEEAQAVFDADMFKHYFTGLVRDVPGWLVRGQPPVVFRVNDSHGKHLWLVDYRARVVRKADSDEERQLIVIEIPVLVMNACVKMRMFNVLGPSKRLRVVLPDPNKQALAAAQKALSIPSWHDQDYFPLRVHLSPRSLASRLRRWRDIYQFGVVLFKYKMLRRPLVVSELWPVSSP